MNQIQAGTIVILKSGGPKMTVDTVDRTDTGRVQVWCIWFDGQKQVSGSFPIEALEPLG